jgi:hypothetical protein
LARALRFIAPFFSHQRNGELARAPLASATYLSPITFTILFYGLSTHTNRVTFSVVLRPS